MRTRRNDLTAVAIRHVAFEDLGNLAIIFRELGFTYRYVDATVDAIDTADGIDCDLLVILGGPIGAYEEHLYPFLKDELHLIERRLKAGRATLGICLGAQLMARALGARVYAGPQKEIGWSELSLTPEGQHSALRHLAGSPVLHWHGDTFELPAGVTRLASTQLFANQAYSWRKVALGLQFHIEAMVPALEGWFVGHACEIGSVGGLSVNQLRADSQRLAPALLPRAMTVWREWLLDVMANA